MSDVAVISGPSTAVLTPTVKPSLSLALRESSQPTDQVELSEVGQLLGRLTIAPPIRSEKVAQIRQAIQDGTYETPDKIDRTVDALMDVLNLH